MSGRELYKIMIKNDLDFVIDKIIEKNNDLTIKELKIEELEKEIERLNNIIKNLDKMFEYYFIGNKKYDENTVNTIYIKYIKLKELKENK